MNWCGSVATFLTVRPRSSYQLRGAVNVETHEQLLASSAGDVEIRFSVEEIQLAITHNGIDVLLDEPARAPDQ